MKRALFPALIFIPLFAFSACGGDDTRFVQADGGAADGALPAGVVIDATPIDFGHADCGGAAPAAKSIHVANGSTTALHWSATISGSTIFSIAPPANAVLPAGSSIDISVAVAALPASTPFAKTETANVTIYTDDANHFQTTIPILETASGASLSLSKSSLDFGDVPLDATSAAVSETLTNSGDEAVTLSAPTTAKSFSLAWPSSPSDLSIAASSSATLTSTFVATTPTSSLATFPFAVKSGHLCGSPPTVSVEGEGTTGALSFQPGALDFGLVDCGTTSAMAESDRTITITNSGNQTLTWQAALRRGASSFYDLATTGTTLAAGASGTIVVTPHAIPRTSSTANDFYADGIYVTTDVPLDVPHLIELHETAHGAILVATADDVFTFRNGSVGRQMTDPIQVTNVGNAPYENPFASITGSGFGLATSALHGSVIPGDSSFQLVTFLPTTSPAGNGSLSFVHSGGVVCGADPVLPLQGIVTEPSIFVPVAAFRFEDVACGTFLDPQTISVTNTSGDTLHLINGVNDSEYNTSPGQCDVSSSATQSVTFTRVERVRFDPLLQDELQISWSSGTAPGVLISTPIVIDTRTALLDFPNAIDFGAQQIGSDAQFRFTIINQGTSPASVVLPQNIGDFSFELPQPFVLPGDTTTVIVHFHPTAPASSAEDISPGVSEETVVCPDYTEFGAIHLTGSGIDNGVIIGPSYVDLGRDPCGVAPSQPVVIANHANVSFNWNASINGSWAGGGPLAPGASATIDVSNVPTPLFGHLDSLQIATDLPGDVAHKIGIANNKTTTGLLPPTVCP